MLWPRPRTEVEARGIGPHPSLPTPSRFFWVDAGLIFLATLAFAFMTLAPQWSAAEEAGLAADVGLAAHLDTAPSWLLPIDDPYIFIRYAQQAARGRLFQWTDGEPSTGASSFLYPFFMVPFQWVSRDLVVWSWGSRLLGFGGLWLLGLAANGLFQRLGMNRSWALAGGILVIWSGPVGLSSMAGMETALASAALVAVCSRWGGHSPLLWPLLAFLPLLRPELFGITLVAVLLALVSTQDVRVKTLVLVFLPTAAVTATNIWLTNHPAPAALNAKSLFVAPFFTPGILAQSYAHGLLTKLSRPYLGLEGGVLWPPVGILGIGMALVIGLRRLRGQSQARALEAVALAWLLLCLASPVSTHLTWQYWRHHHPALVLCWILAISGVYTLAQGLRISPRTKDKLLPILSVVILATTLPMWGLVHLGWARGTTARHGAAFQALQELGGNQLLAVNDAGLPALAHDGPMIDLIGLGTPTMTTAWRHGSGAVVEALARLGSLPDIAALNLDLEQVPPVVGAPLIPVYDLEGQTILALFRQEIFTSTRLSSQAGVDVAHLEDERQGSLVFTRPPIAGAVSAALIRASQSDPDLPLKQASIQGCRPLYEAAHLPAEETSGSIVATTLGTEEAHLRLSLGSPGGPGDDSVSFPLPLDQHNTWQRLEFHWPSPPSDRYLWIERVGDGLPCLESISWNGRPQE